MDGHVQVKDIGQAVDLAPARMRELRERGVFDAVKYMNLWWVPEEEIPQIMYRINQYTLRQPFDPANHITVKDAADKLGVTVNAVYAVIGETLDLAEGELWKCVTRASLNKVLARRGRRRSA